jgi:putative hydrolase of the HAD superfamily
MITNKFKIDGIIFDLGSTLIEYETIPWEKLNVLCSDSGFDFLERNGYKIPSRTIFFERQQQIRLNYREKAYPELKEWRLTDALGELLQYFSVNGSKEFFEGFCEAFYRPIADQLFMFEDTPVVLDEFKKLGKKIGLVSNTIFPEKYHLEDLKRFNLNEYFDFKIFSVSFGYKKPHPLIYQKAADLMGILPQEILFVGDRFLEDAEGPARFGFNSVLKYRNDREYPYPIPPNIPVINSLSELTSLVI